MAKLRYPFSPEVFRTLQAAPADAKAAKRLLLIAAEGIRRREPLPMGLGEWLADAIETAMLTPEKLDPDTADPAAALLFALHLRARNRRPAKALRRDVYSAMAELMDAKMTKCKAGKIAAEKFDSSTSRAVIKKAKKELMDAKMSEAKAAEVVAGKFGISISTAKRVFTAEDISEEEYQVDQLEFQRHEYER